MVSICFRLQIIIQGKIEKLKNVGITRNDNGKLWATRINVGKHLDIERENGERKDLSKIKMRVIR